MRTLTQPRMFAAAGLLLLAAGLLWGAFRHEKPGRLPPGWQPVNDRLAATIGDGGAGSEAEDGAADDKRNTEGTDSGSAPDGTGQAGEGAARPGGDAAEAAGTDAPGDAESSGEPSPAPAAGFDINRATEAEWDELPGIGPAKARAIVEDRERNGPFRDIDDLARVKGIGPKLLERLREAIEARNASGG